MLLYHADRAQTLSAGRHVTLNNDFGHLSPSVLGEVAARYPGGLSKHGHWWYADFWNPGEQCLVSEAISWVLEVLAEQIRQQVAPSAPSRLTCMFAMETPGLAQQFGHERSAAHREPWIWSLDVDSSFRADMNLLRGRSPIEMAYWLERYWQQEAGPEHEPVWEHLVPLPVTVGHRVH